MDKNIKLLALNLLQKKKYDSSITYDSISSKTGYSKRQLIRFSRLLDGNEDMEALSLHGGKGKEPANKASQSEIEFLRKFKEPYPSITVSQFRDFFIEDIIDNPAKTDVVQQYDLKPRSLSWFRNLFIENKWESPESRKPLRRDGRAAHPLRKPSSQRGQLLQIDGTPFDWLGNSKMYTLHLAVDDATSEPLAGCFLPTERQLGYCIIMRKILFEYGIPLALYSDKYAIFKSSREDHLTQFGMMMKDLGIEMIFANSAQAKGRIERYNGTVQRRLPNDIIRFSIHDYETLNEWFNRDYLPYIRSKFSFTPLDPNDVFVPIDECDIDSIFSLHIQTDTSSQG